MPLFTEFPLASTQAGIIPHPCGRRQTYLCVGHLKAFFAGVVFACHLPGIRKPSTGATFYRVPFNPNTGRNLPPSLWAETNLPVGSWELFFLLGCSLAVAHQESESQAQVPLYQSNTLIWGESYGNRVRTSCIWNMYSTTEILTPYRYSTKICTESEMRLQWVSEENKHFY